MNKEFPNKNHRLCRPPANATDVERWDGENWIPDDGQPGFVFSGRIGSLAPYSCPPYAFGTDCDSSCDGFDCVFWRGMRRASERFGCSNGHHVAPVEEDQTFEKTLTIWL